MMTTGWAVLVYVSGLVVGLTFAGGVFVGAWQERQRGTLFNNALTNRFSQLMKKLESSEETVPEGSTWGNNSPKKGSEHPSGPLPPTPDQIRNARRDPSDWRKSASSLVDRMKTSNQEGSL